MRTQNEISDEKQKKIYEDLVVRALKKLPLAYAPYSKFHVGAALLSEDGTVVTGVNVENAAYPAGTCAERTAIFAAAAAGMRRFRAIAVVGCHAPQLSEEAYKKQLALSDYCPPCGICRQVMREFSDPQEFEVILAKSPKEYRVYRLAELLPESFGPENL